MRCFLPGDLVTDFVAVDSWNVVVLCLGLGSESSGNGRLRWCWNEYDGPAESSVSLVTHDGLGMAAEVLEARG